MDENLSIRVFLLYPDHKCSDFIGISQLPHCPWTLRDFSVGGLLQRICESFNFLSAGYNKISRNA